jgi:hypothetical protein
MQFDFGQNWIKFSRRALTHEKVEQARSDFMRLFSGIDVAGKTMLETILIQNARKRSPLPLRFLTFHWMFLLSSGQSWTPMFSIASRR